MLPLLASLVLFLSTSAVAFNRKMSLTHAAEEGARYGATVPPTQAFSSGTWATNVRDVIIARASGELDPSTGATVCVSLVEGMAPTVRSTPNPASWYTTNADGSACDPADVYSPYNPPSDIGLRVQVVVTASAELEAIAFSTNVTLNSSAISRSETDS